MGTIPSTPTFTPGQVLTAAELEEMNDVMSFWANPPRCSVYKSSTQSIPNATTTTLTFAAELFDIVQSGDTESHSTSTNTSRVYARTTGKYKIGGQIQYASNATGYRIAQIILNGSTQLVRATVQPVSGASSSASLVAVVVNLTAGDYIELQGYQNSGGALNTTSGRENTFLFHELVAS